MMKRFSVWILILLWCVASAAGQIRNVALPADLIYGEAHSLFVVTLLKSGAPHLYKPGEDAIDLDSAATFFRRAITVSDSLALQTLKRQQLVPPYEIFAVNKRCARLC